ncbi:MAG: hypothetical protein EOP05_06875, partial [Proteobacteria bacterium]
MTELAGIPILHRHPEAFLGTSRAQAVRLLQRLAFDANQTLSRASEKELVPATRQRLEAIAGALKFNREVLIDLFKPLLDHELTQSFHQVNSEALSAALAPKSDEDLNLNFANVFRDWAWVGAETSEHLRILNSFLPKGNLGKVLILGAGSARLAYDLAASRDADEIVASEINPLLFLTAKKILAGETIELFEIAELPNSSRNAVAKRSLKKPSDALTPTTLKLVFDDFTDSNLPADHFDVVITPWFVDVVGLPLTTSAHHVNGFLKQGGSWINFGPLMFQTASRAELLTFDEAQAVVADPPRGFELLETRSFELTQLKSDLSATFRTDQLFGWRLEKTKASEAAKISAPEPPDYFTDLSKPITMATQLPVLDLEEIGQSHRL